MSNNAQSPVWGRNMKSLLGCIFLVCACAAQAENDCEQSNVRWAEDPLLLSNAGITAYVTSAMIGKNEAGEYFVDNTEGFFDSEPMSFFKGNDGNEYAMILTYSRENFTGSKWLTLEELDAWVVANIPK